MRLEAARIICDWLRDDTYGYAAKLAGLALDGSDVRPDTIADSSIVDATRNIHAAVGRFDGLTLPALIVSVTTIQHRDPELPQGATAGADGYVIVRIRYAERKTDAAASLSDSSYAMAAVIASLRELHSNANVTSRTRNSVRLVSCEELTEIEAYEETPDAWLTSAVEAKYYARNLLPLGA